MGAVVLLKDETTGEVRRYRDEFFDREVSEFLWTEGNYACDCNRASFFAQAGNENEAEFRPCGEERYTAIKAECDDGSTVTLDDCPENLNS